MGLFSDYVESIKQQTENLREVTTVKSGIDCSTQSIGGCANVINALSIDETANDYDIYSSPSWYPDIKKILEDAQDIVVGSTTYYPLYAMVLANIDAEDSFIQTAKDSANMHYGTGCSAYIFSDTVNNDINNADSSTLQIGASVSHTWDSTKDYKDYSDETCVAVRWVVCYHTSRTTKIVVSPGNLPVKEMYVGECSLSEYSFTCCSANGSPGVTWRNYVNSIILSDATDYTTMTMYNPSSTSLTKYYNFFYVMSFLQTLILPKLKTITNFSNMSTINTGGTLYGLNSLTNLQLPALQTISFTAINSVYVLGNCQRLKSLNLPALTTITSTNNVYVLSGLIGLKSLNLNSSLSVSGNAVALGSGTTYLIEGSINLPMVTKATSAIFYRITNIFLPPTQSSAAFTCSVYSKKCKKISIPSSYTNTTWISGFGLVPYIELFNNFDIDGCSFSSIYRSDSWLVDLCGWLKDNSETEAKTITLGSNLITRGNNIYILYDSENINNITTEGVTSLTDGAVSVIGYITNVKNWTVS